MIYPLLIIFSFFLFFACQTEPNHRYEAPESPPHPYAWLDSLFASHPEYKSDGFDYPVGPEGYYNAQPFGKNLHLGDDWNAVTGGNTDLGDTIYSVANGYVINSKDYGGGWGKVLEIVHWMDDSTYVKSLYAHCDTLLKDSAQWVKRGQPIGTIGNVDGMYWAHLHLEIRTDLDLPLGGGYGEETEGYVDPTVFIEENLFRK